MKYGRELSAEDELAYWESRRRTWSRVWEDSEVDHSNREGEYVVGDGTEGVYNVYPYPPRRQYQADWARQPKNIDGLATGVVMYQTLVERCPCCAQFWWLDREPIHSGEDRAMRAKFVAMRDEELTRRNAG